MEQVTGNIYFTKAKKQTKQFNYLNRDIVCDVLVVGGGIDGAIANYYLSKKYDCVLVDKSRFGYCLTSAATALLEYQLDSFANELKNTLTEQQVVDVYSAGLYGISKLSNFLEEVGNGCEFNLKDTLVYSNKKSDEKCFMQEYEFRKSNGFNVEYLNSSQKDFGFKIEHGLYCKNGGAECNPYLLCGQFIENASNQNNLFEHTEIVAINKTMGGYEAVTNYGFKVSCKRIVAATGFNYSLFTSDKLCEKFITYSIVTNPTKISFKNNALVQDKLNPYHYLRILPDNRIIFGGEDTEYLGGAIDQNLAQKNYEKLFTTLKNMFPEHAEKLNVEYKFCGVFASTKNNMGLIGSYNDDNLFYFLSCGANGIINALFGVETLLKAIDGKADKFSELFSPKRS